VIEALLLILLLALLLVLDLAAASARTSFQETSYARLLGLREQFGERSNRAISLFHTYARTLASLNLLMVMNRFFLAGWVLLVLHWQNPALAWWWAVLALVAAGLLLFAIEHGVTNSARHDPERTLIRFNLYIYFWTVILLPFTTLSLALSQESAVPEEAPGSVTEDELKTMLDAGQEEGMIEQGERRMINSVIDLGDTLAREIMVPRIDILALEVTTPLHSAIDTFLSSGHSRVPVYEENIDHTLGLLFAKDLLRVWREGQQIESLHGLLHPAFFVPEAKRVDDLLAEMQSQRIHMALVVDEYGGIAGIVTLEDIVEEVLGEIRDEYDQAEELPYQVLKNGDTLFQGRISLDDFNEVMGSSLPTDEADSLGGYIYSHLDHVPAPGEQVQDGNLVLIVEQVSARRIRKVRARWLLAEEESKKDNHHVNG